MSDYEIGDQDDELVPEEWPTYYTPVPVWLLLSGCSAKAYRMYAFLGEHINNRVPGRRIACPKQVAIARVLSLRDDRKVARYRKELEELGAVRVEEYRYGGGMRRGYRYVVRFNPPAGFEGLLSLQAFYEANPDVRSAKAEGRTRTATSKDVVPPAATGKSAGPDGAGQAPVGPAGGAPAAKKPKKMSASGSGVTLAPEVLQVLAAFPQVLRDAMRETAHTDSPKTLVTAVTKALQDRTAAQLVDRVSRRWWAHGYEQKFEAGELARPVGAAVAMLRHGECPNGRCENGRVLDTGADCVLCIERGKDYKSAAAGARKAEQDAAADAKRRVMCPACERDRGTNGVVCPACVDGFERAVAEAADRAASDIEAVMDADRGGEAREHVLAEAKQAREQARKSGAAELGQLLAARLAADTAAGEARQILMSSALSARDQEAAEVPAQASAPAAEREPVPCGGERWDGSQCHRTTTAEDGLCSPCRGALHAKQQEDLAAAR